MVNLSLRYHPDVLFGYSSSHVQLIIRVENSGEHPVWSEADISIPEHVSLAPNTELRKGRVRVGIVEGKEFLEKAVRVYANAYTNPQMYRCNVTLYTFNKNGIIESRMEKSVDIRCELKKEASF
ncbi:hypothetical protein GF318_03315 [Candidatus Micrarchaeota archaeon]|nr:hypothetical protein [Candidatus Micrarchaeota archaeon]